MILCLKSSLNKSHIQSFIRFWVANLYFLFVFIFQIAFFLVPVTFWYNIVNGKVSILSQWHVLVLSIFILFFHFVSQFDIARVQLTELFEHLIVHKFAHIFDSDITQAYQPFWCNYNLIFDDAIFKIALLHDVEFDIILIWTQRTFLTNTTIWLHFTRHLYFIATLRNVSAILRLFQILLFTVGIGTNSSFLVKHMLLIFVFFIFGFDLSFVFFFWCGVFVQRFVDSFVWGWRIEWVLGIRFVQIGSMLLFQRSR